MKEKLNKKYFELICHIEKHLTEEDSESFAAFLSEISALETPTSTPLSTEIPKEVRFGDEFEEFKRFLELSEKMRIPPPDSDNTVYGPPPFGFDR